MDALPMHPNVHDRETAGFFEAAAAERLVYRACEDCRHALHPPTGYCKHCGSWNTAWREASGRGRLHSWTTVHHSVHPAYPAPYTVVVVELDDTPEVRLLGRLDGEPHLSMGQTMRVSFQTLADGVVLPQWQPADA